MNLSSRSKDELIEILAQPQGWEPSLVEAAAIEMQQRGFRAEQIETLKEQFLLQPPVHDTHTIVTGPAAKLIIAWWRQLKAVQWKEVRNQVRLYVILMAIPLCYSLYKLSTMGYEMLFSGEVEMLGILVRLYLYDFIRILILLLLWMRHRWGWGLEVGMHVYILTAYMCSWLLGGKAIAIPESIDMNRYTLGNIGYLFISVLPLIFLLRKPMCRYFRLRENFAYGLVVVAMLAAFLYFMYVNGYGF